MKISLEIGEHQRRTVKFPSPEALPHSKQISRCSRLTLQTVILLSYSRLTKLPVHRCPVFTVLYSLGGDYTNPECSLGVLNFTDR